MLSAIHPLWAVPGGRLDLIGDAFPVTSDRLPAVHVGGSEARVTSASRSRLGLTIPSSLPGGRTPIRVEGIEGETAFVEIGTPIATGVHQVDNPVFDAGGHLYLTYSGTRGEQVPVSIFRVRPDGTREPFVSGIVNATSLAFDATGVLHVSSRFDGTVYRVTSDGHAETFVTDLGVACGLAFARDGSCYVGDRTGTIFSVSPSGDARPFATLPASIAAFHLAVGPDEALYVTGPTLSPRDHLYRIDPSGHVETYYSGFGRPQGLAFDAQGALYVVEALAGLCGIVRLRADRSPELILSGADLVGLAFDPRGGLVAVSKDTAYRLSAPLRPLRV